MIQSDSVVFIRREGFGSCSLLPCFGYALLNVWDGEVQALSPQTIWLVDCPSGLQSYHKYGSLTSLYKPSINKDWFMVSSFKCLSLNIRFPVVNFDSDIQSALGKNSKFTY